MMRHWLATAADQGRTDWVKRFDPRYWLIDFPRPMMAAVTTHGPDALTVDVNFLTRSDLAGLIWESVDRFSHPLLAVATSRDYRHCTLAFRWQADGGVLPLDAVNGPVLTIEGRDAAGQPHNWYVRLWNYASGSPDDAEISLDFDVLAGGFLLPSEADPVAADSQPGCFELAFYDTSRDYQPGLQRARRSAAATSTQQSLAAAMSPIEAKALAIERLHAGQAGRWRRSLRLPWRYVGLSPGMLVSLADEATIWRVREARFENFIVHLDLERSAKAAAGAPLADGGRVLGTAVEPAGETALHVLDLPPLDGAVPAVPRLWIAGTGAAPGWRRTAVLLGDGDGADPANVGQLEGGTVIGSALTALPPASTRRWDRFSQVDIELLAERDWLELRSEAAVLSGANMALLGDELVQFTQAEALAPRRFRLTGLLRGRRGTETAVDQHVIGERFVLIDTARMLLVDLPLDRLGRAGMARPAGGGDAETAGTPFVLSGNALRPLAPVHLRARRQGGDILLSWVRRSRSGFGWLDFVDAPMAEEREAYRVEVRLDGQLVRQAEVVDAAFVYAASDRAADGGGTIVDFAIAQLSAVIGPGAAATVRITL